MDFIRPRLSDDIIYEIHVAQLLRRARQDRAKWFAQRTGGTLVVHEGMFGVKCEDEDGPFIFHVR